MVQWELRDKIYGTPMHPAEKMEANLTLHTLMDEMAQREIFFKEDDDLNYDQDALNRTASKDPSSTKKLKESAHNECNLFLKEQ